MPEIRYAIGDATAPVGDGPKLIAHVANDVGAWGAGFTAAINERWMQPYRDYRDWYIASGRLAQPVPAFGLGGTCFTEVDDSLWVASMVAQHGTRGWDNPKPIRYGPLERCLAEVGRFAQWKSASVHMPRIGCGLAGGSWDVVEPLIQDALCARGIAVTVYDLKENP